MHTYQMLRQYQSKGAHPLRDDLPRPQQMYAMPGHLARRFQQLAVACFHKQVERCGHDLTPVQFASLVAIHDDPGLDQATLASRIAYDRATIGGVVDRLVRKGLVDRKVSQTDRRARVLAVTGLGQSMLKEVAPAVAHAQRDIFNGLSESEAAKLLQLLRKAIEANAS